MKQSTSSNSSKEQHSLYTGFDEREIEVSEILLNLSDLISKSESRNRFPFSWVRKRRRSALPDSNPSPQSQSQSLQRNSQDEFKREKLQKVNVEAASSPATPLLFSPSESDEKSKNSQRNSSKRRTREDWLEIVDELTRRGDLLRGEVETVKCYYNKLKAINLELKATKQELCFGTTERERRPQLGISKRLNLGMGFPFLVHQQPFIIDQTADKSPNVEKVQYPKSNTLIIPPLSGSGSGFKNQMGPLGIPDLNVSVDEACGSETSSPSSQWLDLNSEPIDNKRTKAAEARKRRMIRIKEMKNSFAAIKPPRFT